MTYWHNSTDESLGIRRQRDSGLVIQNGEIHIGLLTQAKRVGKKSFYPIPTGTALKRMNTVENGDVLYTKAGLNARINSMSGGGGGERHNSNKIRCVSSLCGQGVQGDGNNEILLEEIQFQGLAEQGTTDQGINSNGMFNVMRGGIKSRINETMWTIEEGDWLEMYCPTESEAVQGKGTHQHMADREGERKVWLRTFNPESHRQTPKAIYRCLSSNPGLNGGPEYSKRFKAACEAYLDSVIEQTALAASTLGNDADGAGFYNRLNTKENRARLRDKLFARYLPDAVPETMGAALPDASGLMKQFQQQSAGKYIASVGDLVHHRTKNVVARATSAALPGHMYNCQVCSYGSK